MFVGDDATENEAELELVVPKEVETGPAGNYFNWIWKNRPHWKFWVLYLPFGCCNMNTKSDLLTCNTLYILRVSCNKIRFDGCLQIARHLTWGSVEVPRVDFGTENHYSLANMVNIFIIHVLTFNEQYVGTQFDIKYNKIM